MSSDSGDESDIKPPQQILDEFWENLVSKKPGKVTNIFPPSLYANLLPPHPKPGPAKGKNAAESYQAAADQCRARVKRIVRECRRTNEKFTDPDFDIEDDFGTHNCLEGLLKWYKVSTEGGGDTSIGDLADAFKTIGKFVPAVSLDVNAAAKALDGGGNSNRSNYSPESVHRIDWIYEDPHFTVDGFSSSDVQQGGNGDCWFIAAVATICSSPSLMHKICVERDEECGAYGFVFYRDGEWTWTVVDDNLYLKEADFDAYIDNYDPSAIKERKWKKNYQTGSNALYFASCADQNETWLPLLEKAYAKVHGDYDSIAGGSAGEAVEDLTGGVTNKVMTNRILSKNVLWKELLEVNKTFLFAVASPGSSGGDSGVRRGLALNHAYSIIKAVEEEDEDGKKYRLVQIRNPWGRRSWSGVGEWNGAWADGSKEWTPYWMNKLNYRFADDGLFWMSYDDLRSRFPLLYRTRLFDKNWTVVQQWTSVDVSWVTGYLTTKFQVEIKKPGPTVFVLCQLDDRYFRGLKGKYSFDLHFLLREEGAPMGDHIVRARGAMFGNRSISAEVDLEPGVYEVVPKIVAVKHDDEPDVHEVVTELANTNPQKLRQIGLNYDIANAKGIVELTEQEKKEKEEKRKEAAEKKRKAKEDKEKEKAEFEEWKKEKREKEEKEKEKKEEIKEEVKKELKEELKEQAKDEANKQAQDNSKDDAKEDKDSTKENTGESVKESSKEDIKDESQIADPPKAPEKGKAESSEQLKEEKKNEQKEQDPKEPVPTTDKSEAKTKVDETTPAQVIQPPESQSASNVQGNSVSEHKRVVSNDISAVPALEGEDADDNTHGDDTPAAEKSTKEEDHKQNPWNAVCVLGLRVYSQDEALTIKLVKPKNPEEAALLDADGATQAGATL